MRKLVLLALIAGATGACQDAGSPTDANEATAPSEASLHRTNHDLRDARSTLIANANRLSEAVGRHGVANAIGHALTRDALFLGPRSNTLQGREAAVNYLTTNPIAPSAMRWEVIVADVSADGQRGYTWLEGTLTIDLGAGPAERPGFLLAFWDRRDFNDWKISAFVFNLGGPQTDPIPDGFGTPDTRRSKEFDIRLRKERAKLLDVDAAFCAMSVSDGSPAPPSSSSPRPTRSRSAARRWCSAPRTSAWPSPAARTTSSAGCPASPTPPTAAISASPSATPPSSSTAPAPSSPST